VFDTLSDKLEHALGGLRGRGKLDEESISRAMREIRLALLEADVNLRVVRDFVARVRERALGEDVAKSLTPGQQVVKIVHEELTALMGAGSSKLAFAGRPPTVILLAGLQGSGKTTAAAKLALLLRKQRISSGRRRSTSWSNSADRSRYLSTETSGRTLSSRPGRACSGRRRMRATS
jgi:signal recognition particle subunit SRP54